MGLSASRIVDDRRRRRLAMETDLDGPVAESVRGANDYSVEEGPEPLRLTVSLTHLIPSRLWKSWAAGGVALSALAGLLVAWLFAEEASASGSPLGDMISPLADRLLRGTGAASRLMDGIMALARAEGAKVLPLCGYASAWLRRHKEHRDLVA